MKTSRLILAALLLAGCSADEIPVPPEPGRNAEAPPPKTAEPDTRRKIVAFGDSLSAGHGVAEGHSFPDYLQVALDEAGFAYGVVNAGISGDTTSGGVARLGSILRLKPAVVILELGGNDGLRGLPIETTRANLEEMAVALKESGATVVLAGMTLPPNYGPDYIGAFEQVYKDLAAAHGLALIPFLLEGVGGHAELMQDDGIHPTAEGHRITAGNVMKVLAPLLDK